MELKAWTTWRKNKQETKFQSHLYGIEREKEKEGKEQTQGFNRTFMELKVQPYRITDKRN